MGPNHLSRLEYGEVGRSLDDQLLDDDLFWIKFVLDYLEEIALFLATG